MTAHLRIETRYVLSSCYAREAKLDAREARPEDKPAGAIGWNFLGVFIGL